MREAVQDVTPPTEPADRWSPGRIGELVATYRRQRKLKVSQLAREIGVTPSLISQIERGNSRPSVATLFALAEALDVSVDVFAGRDSPASPGVSGTASLPPPAAATPLPANESRYVVRKGDRRTLAIDGGVGWELLTPDQRADVEFLELVYEPHAESNPSLYRHPGFEMVLVLSGRFDIHIGFDVHRLEAGDSIAFPSSLPHRYVNPDEDVSRAVTAIIRDLQLGDAATGV
jgi:transcriptional regulator with XRE-family HTH domain